MRMDLWRSLYGHVEREKGRMLADFYRIEVPVGVDTVACRFSISSATTSTTSQATTFATSSKLTVMDELKINRIHHPMSPT